MYIYLLGLRWLENSSGWTTFVVLVKVIENLVVKSSVDFASEFDGGTI